MNDHFVRMCIQHVILYIVVAVYLCSFTLSIPTTLVLRLRMFGNIHPLTCMSPLCDA
jgi:hypothetical protein